MNIDRTMKIGIVSSVIASGLFIYLLDPAVRFITFLLSHVFGSLFRTYMDRLFEQAALLNGPDPSLYLLFLFFAMFCGVVIGTSVAIIIWKLTGDASKAEPTSPRRISPFWICAVLVGLSMALTVCAITSIHATIFQLRITSSFNQHLTAISPYVSDQELKMMRSRWTQMTSELDYVGIYADLTRIAATNSVRLPENKVFSLSSF